MCNPIIKQTAETTEQTIKVYNKVRAKLRLPDITNDTTNCITQYGSLKRSLEKVSANVGRTF
ncbi:hypothetical protein NTE_03409 [Candidatus Nitrososphaera evergladensis SR1]|uniref:Uncharacterized protein n=1 Tax=Candidatus Nitrososphaera evergladensis SR1 TaxID=1459636 RepID=A0A075MXU3_9ARCH|nr:hypothetical protein NTE_03409 [Candidatus Nitrososphaera evergladensis SR1]